MTLPRTVAEVLTEHVVFEVESIDRMYLNVYVPQLQRAGQVAGFLMREHGFQIASTALVAPMSRAFVDGLHRYAASQGVPMVHFAKGQRKDDVMHERLQGFTGTDEVVFIGVAQEKAHVFRTERRHNPVTGAPYPWIVPASAVVNHYYVYARRRRLRPVLPQVLLATSRTPPGCASTGTSTPNGRPPRQGSASPPWTTAFAAFDDPADVAAVQAICDGLTDERDRRAAAQVAGPAATPVHPRGPGRRVPLRHLSCCRPSSP